jgi:hypothetical protein
MLRLLPDKSVVDARRLASCGARICFSLTSSESSSGKGSRKVEAGLVRFPFFRESPIPNAHSSKRCSRDMTRSSDLLSSCMDVGLVLEISHGVCLLVFQSSPDPIVLSDAFTGLF